MGDNIVSDIGGSIFGVMDETKKGRLKGDLFYLRYDPMIRSYI